MKFYLLLCFLFAPLDCYPEVKQAITFGWGGRLGDNILDYTHAKWISYKTGIPLLFQPFEYSDQFAFHHLEEQLTPEKQAEYSRVILYSLSQLNQEITTDTLFFLPHACDSLTEFHFLGSPGLFVPVDWTDEHFRHMMQASISPLYPLNLTFPPSGIISVALHFREGGGFNKDTEDMKRGLPLRFPDMYYYIQQLRTLHEMVHYAPIYVYLFTDHPDPGALKEWFRYFFPENTIIFACRETGNRHDANVLEDLFSMMNFDCLIRPMSHYSMTASRLGNYKIDIVPKHGYFSDNRFIISAVDVIEKAKWDPIYHQWNPL